MKLIEHFVDGKIAGYSACASHQIDVGGGVPGGWNCEARENFADVYASADKQGFTGPGGGFSTEQTGKEGAFGTFGEGRGRKDY